VTVHAARPITPQDKSRELQRKLYLEAKRCRNRRFHALYDRIFRPDILRQAWEEVRRNGGSAGQDGVTIEDVEREGVVQFLGQIEQDLKAGTYRPSAVLRVYIPKADGRQRPLGIPTVRDRVVQQACKMVMEPIFEANFRDNSYGFRPKRSAQQAVCQVKKALITGWWVVDADIQSYFDTIDHAMLMSLLKRRISDRRVLKLIHQWLEAGVLEDGVRNASEIGSPQGGVISPLLANIYLHVLDMYWAERYSALGKLIRYADDFVIICRTRQDAETALQKVKQIMAILKLKLHPTKTRVVDMGREGFDFLGFHFHKKKSKKSGKLLPYNWPAQKAMKAVRSKIHLITERRRVSNPLSEVIKFLNRVIRGWRNYFRIGNCTLKFQQLDHYVRIRLEQWVRSKQGSHGHWNERAFRASITQHGLEYFYLPGICAVKP
jgi:group II intron reverse transcriptase/maturase